MLLEYLNAAQGCVSSNEIGKKKVQAGENKRFKRDCQNVTGGNGSSEVERSQFEVEQEVEAIISVSVSLRVAQCNVSGSPSCVRTDEDMHKACVTSGLFGEHAVLVPVSLPIGLRAAALPVSDVMTSHLQGSHLWLPWLRNECARVSKWQPVSSGRPSYLQRSSSSCWMTSSGIGPLQQTANSGCLTISQRNQLRANRNCESAGPWTRPPRAPFSDRHTAVLRVRLFYASCGLAGKQAASRCVGASWGTTDTRLISWTCRTDAAEALWEMRRPRTAGRARGTHRAERTDVSNLWKKTTTAVPRNTDRGDKKIPEKEISLCESKYFSWVWLGSPKWSERIFITCCMVDSAKGINPSSPFTSDFSSHEYFWKTD